MTIHTLEQLQAMTAAELAEISAGLMEPKPTPREIEPRRVLYSPRRQWKHILSLSLGWIPNIDPAEKIADAWEFERYGNKQGLRLTIIESVNMADFEVRLFNQWGNCAGQCTSKNICRAITIACILALEAVKGDDDAD